MNNQPRTCISTAVAMYMYYRTSAFPLPSDAVDNGFLPCSSDGYEVVWIVISHTCVCVTVCVDAPFPMETLQYFVCLHLYMYMASASFCELCQWAKFSVFWNVCVCFYFIIPWQTGFSLSWKSGSLLSYIMRLTCYSQSRNRLLRNLMYLSVVGIIYLFQFLFLFIFLIFFCLFGDSRLPRVKLNSASQMGKWWKKLCGFFFFKVLWQCS